ncbi:hypothetical protein CEXT_105741 [Caerostris extrusa]|uniref:Uncharacterized protein n=1 Tax=Caerostris extrusa TaxID=172846 RepID=A0AAV4P766_CAEEX|nr:hypothetical protein CEXT_105741 [Caerostris extrusa]
MHNEIYGDGNYTLPGLAFPRNCQFTSLGPLKSTSIFLRNGIFNAEKQKKKNPDWIKTPQVANQGDRLVNVGTLHWRSQRLRYEAIHSGQERSARICKGRRSLNLSRFLLIPGPLRAFP